jgi:AraC family transcriptional activator of pobA
VKNKIPAFDFTKQLKNELGFSFSKLEKSYTGYNSQHPHRHKYFEVIYFSNAGGEHEIDFRTYKILSSSIHFVSPDQVHILSRKKNVVGYVLSFTDEFFLEHGSTNLFIDNFISFNNSGTAPVLQLKNPEQIKELESIIFKIEKEFENENQDKKMAIQSLMRLFLIHCKRSFIPDIKENNNVPLQSEITRNFRKLLEKEFRDIKTVNEYSLLLNITPGHLSETIQKDTGKTAGEFIHERIILEAKRLLYHSQQSIKEIAVELNFEDPSYFSKFFKSRSGTTPEQFRKTIREKYQ